MDLIASFYGMFRSLWPFNRERTPLFLRIDPRKLFSIHEISPAYLSLVDFIKNGNKLGFIATNQACALLKQINPKFRGRINVNNILFDLVPTPDGSCSGFADSLLLFLASPNAKLVQSTLSFLNDFVFLLEPAHFHFIDSGFFALLPQSFYENDIHLVAQPRFFLIETTSRLIALSGQSYSAVICEQRQMTMNSYQQTFIDKFFHPIEPFLEFVCRNRRRIKNSALSHPFTWMFFHLLASAAEMEEITQFVLSSSAPLAIVDSLFLFDSNKWIKDLLAALKALPVRHLDEDPTVLKREKQIMTKLHAEGLFDVIELFIHVSWWLEPDNSFWSDFIRDEKETVSQDASSKCSPLHGLRPVLRKTHLDTISSWECDEHCGDGSEGDPAVQKGGRPILCKLRHEQPYIRHLVVGRSCAAEWRRQACVVLRLLTPKDDEERGVESIVQLLTSYNEELIKGIQRTEHASIDPTRSGYDGDCVQAQLVHFWSSSAGIDEELKIPQIRVIFHNFLEGSSNLHRSSKRQPNPCYTLHSIETRNLYYLLESMEFGLRSWQKDDPTFRTRSKQILLKLRDEGVSDEFELHVRYSRLDFVEGREVFMGAWEIHKLGGNVPYSASLVGTEIEEDWDDDWENDSDDQWI
ncbi:hypothetical protein BLNAU_6036 [Blattamonas nauphoetae]|uniref:Uncharacterized protein n=1 Tax=Blattamonas nauphoetae TaxID=2049346 RepID=A0ABQ9Y5K1_9EUKA|nr:hypothetical protein BLNAU_6036 [Blattamonas nauphoetae]